MQKVKLFGTALALIAGLSIAEANVNASQKSNNNTNDVNEVGSLIYSNAYGQDYIKGAHNVSIFKDSNGRYGIGQGTADSTAFFKINKDGTVTIWQLKEDPNTPTYKQGYTKKTVSIASLQKSENSTAAQKSNINNVISSVKKNPSATPTAQSNSSTNNTGSQQLLKDEQVIDDLGTQLYNHYYGNAYRGTALDVNKDSNGRMSIGRGSFDNTIYYKINSDGKTMTVWRPVSNANTPAAKQQYTTSIVTLSSLGFDPAEINAQSNSDASIQSNSNSSAQTSSSSSEQSSSNSSTQTSSATNQNVQGNSSSANSSNMSQSSSVTSSKSQTKTSSALTSSVPQTHHESEIVAKQAGKEITVSSSQGKQTMSYYKIAALLYAKVYGTDRLGNDQGLQLTMNKNHSRFILGEGTADSTLYFRVNQGKKTVTVWSLSADGNSLVKNTYDISSLINEFYNTSSLQDLVNQTATSLMK